MPGFHSWVGFDPGEHLHDEQLAAASLGGQPQPVHAPAPRGESNIFSVLSGRVENFTRVDDPENAPTWIRPTMVGLHYLGYLESPSDP